MYGDEDWTQLPVFSLGDTAESADYLASLIVSGAKRATCYPFEGHAKSDAPLPQPGTNWLVAYSNRRPACIIQTSFVEIKRFKDVNKVFAEAEGEGDLTVEGWKRLREAEFRRNGPFSPEMLLVCHRFRLVKVFSQAGNN